MKKITLGLLISLISHQIQLNAQTVINGSFENTLATCNYGEPNSAIDSLLPNCFGFGNASQIDIMNGTCSFGLAEDGNTFIGLGVPGPGSADAIALELSSPLLIGGTYQLSFYQKLEASYVGSALLVGYSSDSSIIGTLIDSVPMPTSTSWVQSSLVFSPTSAGKFVTFQMKANYYSWNHFDHVTLSDISGVKERTNATLDVEVFPNPTTAILQVELNNIQQGKVIFEITDLTGRIVLQKEMNSNQENISTDFDIHNLSNGMYLLNVKTGTQIYSQKIIKQ
ncbi:hypothetical protein BH09BAC5_BH09BAC5_28760 [soil metagenome]